METLTTGGKLSHSIFIGSYRYKCCCCLLADPKRAAASKIGEFFFRSARWPDAGGSLHSPPRRPTAVRYSSVSTTRSRRRRRCDRRRNKMADGRLCDAGDDAVNVPNKLLMTVRVCLLSYDSLKWRMLQTTDDC